MQYEEKLLTHIRYYDLQVLNMFLLRMSRHGSKYAIYSVQMDTKSFKYNGSQGVTNCCQISSCEISLKSPKF